MSVLTCGVTAGYVWVADAQGRVQITKERLNLAAIPAATLNLVSKVNSDGDDVVNASIKAAMLANEVADALITAVATVAAEAANVVNVSIQFKDLQGNALAAYCAANIWLSATVDVHVPTTLPSGGGPAIISSHGEIITAMTNTAPGIYMSNSSGLLELVFTEAGALTRYLRMMVQDKLVVGSGALVWTA